MAGRSIQGGRPSTSVIVSVFDGTAREQKQPMTLVPDLLEFEYQEKTPQLPPPLWRTVLAFVSRGTKDQAMSLGINHCDAFAVTTTWPTTLGRVEGVTFRR